MQVLTGHTDEESAYVIEDYPYGFRLRCQMRVWVESKPKLGQRVVRQTSNPKRPGLVWNKAKAGTYSAITLLLLDDEGHVQTTGISPYTGAEELARFNESFHDYLDSDQRNTLRYMMAARRAEKHITYSIHTCSGPCDDPIHNESYKEREKHNQEIHRKLTAIELRKESNAALAGEPYDA